MAAIGAPLWLLDQPTHKDMRQAVMHNPHSYREVNGETTASGNDEIEIVMFNPLSSDVAGQHDEETASTKHIPTKNGSILSGYFNISNTILGSSVLGLPYAFSHTGWLMGTFLLILCAASSAFALHTLSLCALKLNNDKASSEKEGMVEGASFYSVGKATLPNYTIIIDVAIALKCIGVAISYLIVVGDLMPFVMQQFGASGGFISRELWVALCFIIALPFNFSKDFSALAWPSSFAIAFVAFFALLVVLYSLHIPGLDPCGKVSVEQCTGAIAPVVMDMHALKAMPIFVFGFTCQQNVFSVVNEMQDFSPGKMNIVIAGAVGTGLLMYLILAGVGYATFGANVNQDFLLSYPDNYFTSMARIFISLLVTFSYPLQCHPARRCLLTIIAQCMPACTGNESTSTRSVCSNMCSQLYSVSSSMNHTVQQRQLLSTVESSEHGGSVHDASDNVKQAEQREYWLFQVVTAGFLVITLCTALAVHDLSIVLAIVGATGSTTVSYILPGFYYFILFDKPGDGPMWKRYLALLQGVAGVIIVPMCLTFIFI